MEKTITTTVMLTLAQAKKEDAAIKYSAEDLGVRLLRMKDLEGWRVLGFDCWSDYLESLDQHRATLYRLMNAAQAKQTEAVASLPEPPTDEPEDDDSEPEETHEDTPEPPKTASNSLEINKSLSHNATDSAPSTETGRQPAQKPAAKPNDKLEAALNYLEKVVGEKEIKAIRDGILPLPDKELILWGSMSDDDIERIAPLVIGHRMTPSEALRFTNKAIDERTRISDLNLLAVGGPLEVTVAGFTTFTFNRRNFADALPKFRKLLGIKE